MQISQIGGGHNNCHCHVVKLIHCLQCSSFSVSLPFFCQMCFMLALWTNTQRSWGKVTYLHMLTHVGCDGAQLCFWWRLLSEVLIREATTDGLADCLCASVYLWYRIWPCPSFSCSQMPSLLPHCTQHPQVVGRYFSGGGQKEKSSMGRWRKSVTAM